MDPKKTDTLSETPLGKSWNSLIYAANERGFKVTAVEKYGQEWEHKMIVTLRATKETLK